MNRQDKQLIINNIKDEFGQYSSSFIVEVQGLTVAYIQNLKKDLKVKGAKLKVAKNTLIKKAVKDLDLDYLEKYLKKQVAIVFAKEDVAQIAKILSNASKKNNNLTLIAGSLENRLIDKNQIEFLASLPSENVLRAQVIGTIQAPIKSLVVVLNQTILKLLFAIKEIAKKQV